ADRQAGAVEQRVHQLAETLDLVRDGANPALQRLRRRSRAVGGGQRSPQPIDVQAQRRERRPQLVGGDRKEVVARLDGEAQVGLQLAALGDVDAGADV